MRNLVRPLPAGERGGVSTPLLSRIGYRRLTPSEIGPCRRQWRSIACLPMVLAVEHIRRMRGGAQSHLMRCDDGGYYVVKFQNNPQHLRILANEMLGTRMASCLGLPVPRADVVEVRRELIELTADLVIQLGTGRTPCRPGRQFGSRYPGDPAELPVYDFLPEKTVKRPSSVSEDDP